MAIGQPTRSVGPCFLLCLLLGAPSLAAAADPFREQLQPFLKTYCFECHNKEKKEADLDLTRYTSTAMLAADFRQWEHVATFVTSGEMPPEKAKQPTANEREELLKALDGVMLAEARKVAGDPGVVLPRRLSNAEYNYTIRDLTGVDIRPADAFPVDPASGEGFSNTGEALLMSPSLFKKQYAAAQHVADHIDFTPTGWSFAPYPVATYADQKKLHEQAIISFYSRHDIDYEAYLAAAWTFRGPQEQLITLERWASNCQLSPKYLRSLSEMLNGAPADAQHYVRWLRERWQAIPAPQAKDGTNIPGEVKQQLRTLAGDLRKLGLLLAPPETAAIVSNAGNGPIQHIDRRNKTAAARDTFNAALLSDTRRYHVDFRDRTKQDKLRVVLHAALLTTAGEDLAIPGYVILKDLNFSTANPNEYRPNDEKRNFPLQGILKEHAPEALAKLKFGQHLLGHEIDAGSIAISTASPIEIELPAVVFPANIGTLRLYADARLDREHTKAGAIRFTLLDHPSTGQSLDEFTFPLVNPDSKVAEELRASCSSLTAVFPNRFCYVDETRGLSAGFHLIEGFFRDDQPLCKHVLNADENRELDRLWNELYFGTHIAEKELRGFVFFERSERNFMKHRDFDSFKEEDPDLVKEESVQRLEDAYFLRSGEKVAAEARATHPIHTFFADIREGLRQRELQLQQAAPNYLQSLEKFAASAYRRPLTETELVQVRNFFQKLSLPEQGGVEHAVRASVIRILVSPHFCYLIDPPPPGQAVQPLSDLALASRLSYFLWSSQPDEELLTLAKAGKLRDEAVLRAQTRRMLKDPKASGFVLEFFGQWLRYRDFNEQESVSREVFPNFDDALRQAMFEEPTRLATHLIQQDRPVTDLLTSDVTFVNKRLAQHYGLPFSGSDQGWNEVAGLNAQGRSGLLGMAVFLTKNSQPQRTSPVKRGFWVVHHLLGEHIPPPPPDVVALPAKETDTNGKTIRQLMALHVEDGKCARCHVRFDNVGLAMEGFDAIGRVRTKDLAGRAIDNLVQLPSGQEARGIPDFARYLAAERATDFTKTLNRKLLGYALGRSLQLSDRPLLETMQANLKASDYRFGSLFETIVTSPQFRNQRGRDFATATLQAPPSGDRP